MASCRFRLKTVASLAPTYHPGSQPVPAVGSQHGRARTASPLGTGSDSAKRSFSFSTPAAALDSTLHMFLLRASLNPSASPSPPEPHLSSPEARPARVPPQPSGSVQTLVGSRSLALCWLRLKAGAGPSHPGVRSSWHAGRRPPAERVLSQETPPPDPQGGGAKFKFRVKPLSVG